ncbi:MAG: hypothetical protein ACU0DW_15865 [Shimia sp.]
MTLPTMTIAEMKAEALALQTLLDAAQAQHGAGDLDQTMELTELAHERARRLHNALDVADVALKPSDVTRPPAITADVSGLAYRVHSLVSAAKHAADNETTGTPMDRRGIFGTLDAAEELLADVIDGAEALEKRVAQ